MGRYCPDPSSIAGFSNFQRSEPLYILVCIALTDAFVRASEPEPTRTTQCELSGCLVTVVDKSNPLPILVTGDAHILEAHELVEDGFQLFLRYRLGYVAHVEGDTSPYHFLAKTKYLLLLLH